MAVSNGSCHKCAHYAQLAALSQHAITVSIQLAALCQHAFEASVSTKLIYARTMNSAFVASVLSLQCSANTPNSSTNVRMYQTYARMSQHCRKSMRSACCASPARHLTVRMHQTYAHIALHRYRCVVATTAGPLGCQIADKFAM